MVMRPWGATISQPPNAVLTEEKERCALPTYLFLLKYLMVHNIDTLGADVDPALLGLHIRIGACLTFEVITRRLDDRGGGLARVNGRVRLVEGLAMPREEAEFALSYYNSNTCWIDLDKLLNAFGLAREDLIGSDCLAAGDLRMNRGKH